MPETVINRRPATLFGALGRGARRYLDLARDGQALLLFGPTGCGKTAFAEWAAAQFGAPLMTLIGSPDMTVGDLVGRWHLGANGSRWRHGPLAVAVRRGLPFYLDEIEAVPDGVLKALYPLLDHRRMLVVNGLGRSLRPASGFAFLGSYNPAYGGAGLSPAFRQRCRFVRVEYLRPDEEQALLTQRGVPADDAAFLVRLAAVTRDQLAGFLPEAASTRLLLLAAGELAAGADRAAVVTETVLPALTDDPALHQTAVQALQAAGVFPLGELELAPAPRRVELPAADDDFFDTNQ